MHHRTSRAFVVLIRLTTFLDYVICTEISWTSIVGRRMVLQTDGIEK